MINDNITDAQKISSTQGVENEGDPKSTKTSFNVKSTEAQDIVLFINRSASLIGSPDVLDRLKDTYGRRMRWLVYRKLIATKKLRLLQS